MKLTVAHRTLYRFEQPVRGVVQSLRLHPADNDGQRVAHWKVTVAGGQTGASFRDGAGDWIETLSLRSQVSELAVEVAGLVETEDRNGVLGGHRETVRPAVYLRRTRATARTQEILDLARDAADGTEGELAAAHALSEAVTAAVAYRPGETGAATTASEALEAGAGVCQDHTHLMIAAAICLDIPARYVTGYLYAGGDADTMGEASHAWAELHVAGLGWVGFDAANACCPDARYIRLGSGFDALDAAPIRGLALGDSVEHLDVQVTVTDASARQSQQQSQS